MSRYVYEFRWWIETFYTIVLCQLYSQLSFKTYERELMLIYVHLKILKHTHTQTKQIKNESVQFICESCLSLSRWLPVFVLRWISRLWNFQEDFIIVWFYLERLYMSDSQFWIPGNSVRSTKIFAYQQVWCLNLVN